MWTQRVPACQDCHATGFTMWTQRVPACQDDEKTVTVLSSPCGHNGYLLLKTVTVLTTILWTQRGPACGDDETTITLWTPPCGHKYLLVKTVTLWTSPCGHNGYLLVKTKRRGARAVRLVTLSSRSGRRKQESETGIVATTAPASQRLVRRLDRPLHTCSFPCRLHRGRIDPPSPGTRRHTHTHTLSPGSQRPPSPSLGSHHTPPATPPLQPPRTARHQRAEVK